MNQTNQPVDGATLVAHLQQIRRRLSLPKRLDTVEVELIVMREDKIIELNNQFHHSNQPTDVLSFPSRSEMTLGSICLNPALAASYVVQSNTSLTEELKMLSGHGLLHLLGFNHR
ncbi:MAG: rRNA maturation RNase YbeY [Patescibacteria group bacterium]